jgi:hypothetical protein
MVHLTTGKYMDEYIGKKLRGAINIVNYTNTILAVFSGTQGKKENFQSHSCPNM